MTREKSGLKFDAVIDAVSHENITARDFIRTLRSRVQVIHGEVSPTQLSEGNTEFQTISDLTESFEFFRNKEGDEAFECQDSGAIDAAAKSHIIDAKVNVLITLGHVEKDSLVKIFTAHLKQELSFDMIKNLSPLDLSELWPKFKTWKGFRAEYTEAAKTGQRPLLESDRADLETLETDITNMRRVLARLEDQRRDLQDAAHGRARDNKDSILQDMKNYADDAEKAFTNELGNIKGLY